jgi:hypothetical protein
MKDEGGIIFHFSLDICHWPLASRKDRGAGLAVRQGMTNEKYEMTNGK